MASTSNPPGKRGPGRPRKEGPSTTEKAVTEAKESPDPDGEGPDEAEEQGQSDPEIQAANAARIAGLEAQIAELQTGKTESDAEKASLEQQMEIAKLEFVKDGFPHYGTTRPIPDNLIAQWTASPKETPGTTFISPDGKNLYIKKIITPEIIMNEGTDKQYISARATFSTEVYPIAQTFEEAKKMFKERGKCAFHDINFNFMSAEGNMMFGSWLFDARKYANQRDYSNSF